MCKKNYVVLLLLPLCLVLCGEIEFGETKLKIVNNTSENFKIKAIRSTYLCGPLNCPHAVTEKNTFLGFFPSNPKPVTFGWLPRSLDWNRYEYAIFTSAGQRIDLLVETGSTWTFAVAKKGGSWGTDNNKNLNLVTGTDLWIKAGASGLIVDAEKRDHERIMQVSPRLYCRIECFITPLLYPNYQLTFTDNASPEVWLNRSLVPGQTNVVFKNSTPIDWKVESTGFYEPDVTVDNKKSSEFSKDTVEKLFSFGPSLPRPTITSRDGSVYFTFTPKQASVDFKGDQLKFEPFVVALYRVGKDQIPQVKMGKSRYRLTKNLSAGGVMLEFTQSPEQWRFNITLSPGILKPVKALESELTYLISEQTVGKLGQEEFDQKKAAILLRAEAIVETLPMAINITTLKNFIVNTAQADANACESPLTQPLKNELFESIRGQRAGQFGLEVLKQKIDDILRRAEELALKQPAKIDPRAIKNYIINATDPTIKEGFSNMVPVFWFGNNLDMIEFFVKRGAALTLQDNRLLQFAIGTQAQPVIDYLLARGVAPKAWHLRYARRENLRDRARDLAFYLINNPTPVNRKTLIDARADALLENDTSYAVFISEQLKEAGRREGRSELESLGKELGCPTKAAIQIYNQQNNFVAKVRPISLVLSDPLPYNQVLVFDQICRELDKNKATERYYRFETDTGKIVGIIKCFYYGSDERIAEVRSADNNQILQRTTPDRQTVEHRFVDPAVLLRVQLVPGAFKIYLVP